MMKKFLIAAVLILTGFTYSLFSVEWGGLVNNVTSVTPDSKFKKFPVNQSNGAFLWFKSALNKNKSLNISTEAMYKYNLLINDGKTKFTNTVDLNLLKLSGIFSFGKNSLFIDFGRFPYSDISGSVFVQNSDGLSVRFGNMNWNMGVYAGYTGLLNRFTVGMTDAVKPHTKEFYDLCYGYVPVVADFTLANIMGSSLIFQTGYFMDISSKGEKSKGFFEFGARGPLSHIGSYSLSAVVGTENFKNIMLCGNFDFSFYATKNIIVSVGGNYTSGNHGKIAYFVPITFLPIHNSQSVVFGADVIVPRLSGMFVLNDLCITVNEKLVTSLPKKGFTVNGLDSSLSAVYNIFSDLQVGGTVTAYADFKKSDFNTFSFTLNAGFTF